MILKVILINFAELVKTIAGSWHEKRSLVQALPDQEERAAPPGPLSECVPCLMLTDHQGSVSVCHATHYNPIMCVLLCFMSWNKQKFVTLRDLTIKNEADRGDFHSNNKPSKNWIGNFFCPWSWGLQFWNILVQATVDDNSDVWHEESFKNIFWRKMLEL